MSSALAQGAKQKKAPVPKVQQGPLLTAILMDHKREKRHDLAPAFIAQGPQGDIGAVVSFRFADQMLSFQPSKIDVVFYDSSERVFEMERLKYISSEFAFFTIKDDKLRKKGGEPISIAQDQSSKTQHKEERLYYSYLKKDHEHFRLKTALSVSRISMGPAFDRLNLAIASSLDHPHFKESLILNELGEFVGIAHSASGPILHGSDERRRLSSFLKSSEENPRSLRNAVINTRQLIYGRAKGGFEADQYHLLYLTGFSKESFAEWGRVLFFHPSEIDKNWERFFQNIIIKVDPWMYFYETLNSEEISPREKRNHYEKLYYGAVLKNAAKKGDPFYQYILGNVCSQLGKHNEALKWFNESSKQGYAPSIFEIAKRKLEEGLKELARLSELYKHPKANAFIKEISRLKDFTLMDQFVRGIFNDNLALEEMRKTKSKRSENKIAGGMFDRQYQKAVSVVLNGLVFIREVGQESQFSPAIEIMDHIHDSVNAVLKSRCSKAFGGPL